MGVRFLPRVLLGKIILQRFPRVPGKPNDLSWEKEIGL